MLQPPAKLDSGVVRSLAETRAGDQVPVIVQYVPTRRVMRHHEALRGVRESYHYRLKPFVHMHATAEAIRSLELDAEVVRVFLDFPVRAYLDTSVPRIQAPRVWSEGLTGENVRIAILDTGLDVEHPDFRGRVADATDFTGEGPVDMHGHGTHVASIAAGSGEASNGVYRGVAPGATICAAKVLRADGMGMMSDVMAGIEWAVDKAVQAISLSLGGPGPCDGQDALSLMCAAAVDAGVVVCVAAGNDGPGGGTIGSPGCAEAVITIGATDSYDHVAGFSSRGPTSDGRVKPDVVLPGTDIIAARARDTTMGRAINEHYVVASGTSMATPHASGVCALLLQAEPDLTPAMVKQRIMSTTRGLGESPYAQGRGCVDAWRAYQNEESPVPEPSPDPPAPGPSPGQGCLTAVVKLLFVGKPRA